MSGRIQYNQGVASKRSYAQPKLCVYGGFASVTASGSNGMAETASMSGMNRRS